MWIVVPPACSRWAVGLPLLHHHHHILSVLKLCAFHLTRGFPIQPFFFLLQVLIEESAIPILMAIKSLLPYPPSFTNKSKSCYFICPKNFLWLFKWKYTSYNVFQSHFLPPKSSQTHHVPTYPTLLFFSLPLNNNKTTIRNKTIRKQKSHKSTKMKIEINKQKGHKTKIAKAKMIQKRSQKYRVPAGRW